MDATCDPLVLLCMAMREIRRRERVAPDMRVQLGSFVRSVLPPLVAHYALRILRAAATMPVVRGIIFAVLATVGAFLFVPAILVGVLAYIATGDSATATMSAVTMTVLAGVVLGVLLAKLYGRWKAFRLRYFGIR